MATFRKQLKTDEDTGFGYNRSMYGKRLLTPDGRPNVQITGLPVYERLSWYHTLIGMKTLTFLIVIFTSFLVINIVFAGVYLLIGMDHLSGINPKNDFEKIFDAFFFSTQTFTTVGYGRISPTGYLTSFIASFQAFSGLLFFAVATGLFYARFSRPKAFIRFSSHALIAPYKDGLGLMFRLAPFKNNSLTAAEVKVVLALVQREGSQELNRFYALPLERSRIDALFSTWTVVHPIDEESPLAGLSEAELHHTELELMVYLRAFDDTFSNTVVARASYMNDQFVRGARFLPMFYRSSRTGKTVVDISKIDGFERVNVPEPVTGSVSF